MKMKIKFVDFGYDGAGGRRVVHVLRFHRPGDRWHTNMKNIWYRRRTLINQGMLRNEKKS